MQVFLKVFAEHNIPLTRLSEMASLAPAKRLGRKAGLLQAGYPADITILSADEEGFVHKDQMLSRSHNTRRLTAGGCAAGFKPRLWKAKHATNTERSADVTEQTTESA
jgi:adenine deaminase